MRKLFIAVSIVLACMLCACGGSKQVVSTTPSGVTKGTKATVWGTELELNECQLLAEESPATRAYGEATNVRLSFAKSYAEGQARAALARAIAGKITTATAESDCGWQKYAGTETEGQSATDQGSKADGSTFQIASEIIQNAVVIKTNQYMQPNRQYHVFVCIEYQGDASAMAKSISERIKQQVPDEERMKMEYQFQKFEEKIKEELEKMGK